jgi:effector-binding domain-containing protein
VHIERATVISAPAHRVFLLVNNLRTYDEWMPWNRKDPKMTQTFSGPGTGVGASYSWRSNDRQVGNGTLTITQSVPDQQVVTAINFGDRGASYGGWFIQPMDTLTRIIWYMDAKMTGPNFLFTVVGRYMGLFMDRMVGPDFEQGLDSLKSLAERTPDVKDPLIKIDTTTIAPQSVLYISDSAASGAELAKKLAQVYGGEISPFIRKKGIHMAGAPLAWYSSDHFPMTFDAGIPVDKTPDATEGRIHIRKITGGPGVVAHFFGPYELDPLGYKALADWLKLNGRTAADHPYEIYVGDPAGEKDPYKVQTDIVVALDR